MPPAPARTVLQRPETLGEGRMPVGKPEPKPICAAPAKHRGNGGCKEWPHSLQGFMLVKNGVGFVLL